MPLLFFYILISSCTVVYCHVIPKSLILPESIADDLELQTQSVTKSKPKSVDNVIWTKLDAIPGQITEHEGNTSGQENLNQASSTATFPFQLQHLIADLTEEEKTETNWNAMFDLGTEPLFISTTNNAFEVSDKEQNDGFVTDANLKELPIANASDTEVSGSENFTSSNFSDSILNILNLSADVLRLQSLSENKTVESFAFDETTLSEEREVTLFQDVSTAGFEILIDSETTRNLLLAELLGSGNFLESEEKEDNEILNDSMDDNSILDRENLNLIQDIDGEMNNTNLPIDIFESFQVFDSEQKMLNESNTEVSAGTEIIRSETTATKCPAPGWCVFWFLAQDTCAEDSHCLGTRICCKSGCSMACLDVDL